MKHQCHCGFKKHFAASSLKSLGLGGGILFVLHLLFHVAECLVFPTILAFFSSAAGRKPAVAIDHAPQTVLATHQELTPSSEQNFPIFSQELTLYYPRFYTNSRTNFHGQLRTD